MTKTPNNRKLADLSYERVEDQRALTIVLAAAEAMANDDHGWFVDDQTVMQAIARVRAHMLVVTEPTKPSSELPGQLGIDGSVVGTTAQPLSSKTKAPAVCPVCNRDMLNNFGTSWTPIHGHAWSIHHGVQYGLQCGHCAAIVVVAQEVWQYVIEERRRAHGDADVKKTAKPGREKRIRGAG